MKKIINTLFTPAVTVSELWSTKTGLIYSRSYKSATTSIGYLMSP
jgi:hypothetical protein